MRLAVRLLAIENDFEAATSKFPKSRHPGLVLSLFGTVLWEVFPLKTLDGE